MTESKPLIVAGADGFGEDLKNVLVEHCRAQGYEVDDLGTGAYYDKAGEVARRVPPGVVERPQLVMYETQRALRARLEAIAAKWGGGSRLVPAAGQPVPISMSRHRPHQLPRRSAQP